MKGVSRHSCSGLVFTALCARGANDR